MFFVFVLYFLTFVATKLASQILTKFAMYFSLFSVEIFAKIDWEYLEFSSYRMAWLYLFAL
jgi:hypothetical protein